MSESFDAIVIGGGFAGASAARELSRAGQSVLMLEARDRLGGRTYTREHDGRVYEMGGTYVHWWQGQAFSEVQRYGLAVEQSPWLADSCFWPTATGQAAGSLGELRSILIDLLTRFFADARAAMPRPFEPLRSAATREFDALSVQDRLDELDITADERVLLAGVLGANGSGATRDIGFLSVVRWYALHEWNAVQFIDREHYGIVGGVGRLHAAIMGDANCDVRLEAPVSGVTPDSDGVSVATRNGDEFRARAAVLAVPLAVLRAIELPADVPEAWSRVATEGVASRGLKVSMWTPPGTPSTFAIGREDAPLSWIVTEAAEDRGTLLVGFGSDGSLLVPDDLEGVRAAMSSVVPGVEILEAYGHNWLADEFAQGTWGFMRPGQLTGALADLQRPHRAIVLAGADIANGWVGLICGAIESGMTAGRRALAEIERYSK